MAVVYNKGRTRYVYLSINNFTDTYTLVCLMKQGLDRERSVTKQDTQCEISKAFGLVDRVMNLSCVTNLTPAALASNVGEASYKLLSTWFEAGTEIRVKIKTPTDGSQQYAESAATITKMSDSTDVGSNQMFDITLELTGDFDETA